MACEESSGKSKCIIIALHRRISNAVVVFSRSLSTRSQNTKKPLHKTLHSGLWKWRQALSLPLIIYFCTCHFILPFFSPCAQKPYHNLVTESIFHKLFVKNLKIGMCQISSAKRTISVCEKSLRESESKRKFSCDAFNRKIFSSVFFINFPSYTLCCCECHII